MIEGSYDLRVQGLNECSHPAKFGGHMLCGSGDIRALVCHVIS